MPLKRRLVMETVNDWGQTLISDLIRSSFFMILSSVGILDIVILTRRLMDEYVSPNKNPISV